MILFKNGISESCIFCAQMHSVYTWINPCYKVCLKTTWKPRLVKEKWTQGYVFVFIMNKSAMFRSKLSFPNVSFGHGPSSVELPVSWNCCKVYIRHKLEIKMKGFVVHARLCTRSRGNRSQSLNHVADWCQVEISVAFPGASAARYLQRASLLEPKRRRLSDTPC